MLKMSLIALKEARLLLMPFASRGILQIPPQIELTPLRFGEITKESFKGLDNIDIQNLDKEEMIKIGMGAVLAVNKGSPNPPLFVVIKYNGGKQNEKPIAFIGKGVTYDSGGIESEILERTP